MRALLSFMPAAAAAATRLSVCFTADIGLNIVTSADVQGFDADMRAEIVNARNLNRIRRGPSGAPFYPLLRVGATIKANWHRQVGR